MAETEVVRRAPLAIEIYDCRDNGTVSHIRSDPPFVFDSVLQHSDTRVGAAQALEPDGSGRCVLRLRTKYDPVDLAGPQGVSHDIGC
ncbi:hypothetical protein PBS_04860 [Paraburkholderia sp. 2C]